MCGLNSLRMIILLRKDQLAHPFLHPQFSNNELDNQQALFYIWMSFSRFNPLW